MYLHWVRRKEVLLDHGWKIHIVVLGTKYSCWEVTCVGDKYETTATTTDQSVRYSTYVNS